MRHDEETFRDTEVAVDGNEYHGCKFLGCTMVFAGGTPPALVDCLFTRSSWKFDGAAARTIAFMTAMYHGMGSGGRELIEQTFANVRGGKPRQTEGEGNT